MLLVIALPLALSGLTLAIVSLVTRGDRSDVTDAAGALASPSVSTSASASGEPTPSMPAVPEFSAPAPTPDEPFIQLPDLPDIPTLEPGDTGSDPFGILPSGAPTTSGTAPATNTPSGPATTPAPNLSPSSTPTRTQASRTPTATTSTPANPKPNSNANSPMPSSTSGTQTNKSSSPPALVIDAAAVTSVDIGDGAAANRLLPILNGTAAPGTKVVVSAQGTELARAKANARGVWSAGPIDGCVVGQTTLEITGIGPDGFESWDWENVTLTGPAVRVVPVEGGYTIQVQDSPATRFELMIDGTAVGAPASMPTTGSWTSRLPSLARGDHVVGVRVVDGSGRVGPLIAATVRV
jgi:hypothetical protein